MESQNPKLPVDLLHQIQEISVVQEKLPTKIDILTDSTLLTGSKMIDGVTNILNCRNITKNLADTIAIDMVAPLMREPMTQQQMYVMSQIMKFPDQIDEIIAAAMSAGVKSPVFKVQ
jgi:hypothetical protein